jgi:uncharacterized protein with HEPN domain
MPVARPVRLRVLDILNMVAFCERHLEGVSLQAFQENELLQRAIERALEIVSEASRYVPDDFKAEATEVPWARVANFGNLLRHGYQEVDETLIYRTATAEILPIKAACETLYARVKQPSDPWPDPTRYPWPDSNA